MNRGKQILALFLVLILSVTMIPMTQINAASKKTKLNKTKATIYVGKTVKLKVKNKKIKQKVKWISKNKKVATVSKKGKVKGKKVGKTTIIAKVGKKKYKCKITVKATGAQQGTTMAVIPEQQIVVTSTENKNVATTQKDSTSVAQTTQKVEVPAETTTQEVVQTTESQSTTTSAIETTKENAAIDVTKLSYTALACTGMDGMSIEYSVVSNSVEGWAAPWYGDGGNTFMFIFSAASGMTKSITINGQNADKNIIVEDALGLLKINPTKLAENAYSIIDVQKENGAFTVVIKKGNGANVPTAAPQQTTEESQQTTKQPATDAPQQTTNKGDQSSGLVFTTDATIAQPFGIVVKTTENGYVDIVWGVGDINCYNVYVDGERRRTAIPAQSLHLPVYTEGEHTVEIATVVGTKESVRVSNKITISGVGEKETEPPTCPPELQPQKNESIPLKDDKILIELNNKTNEKYTDDQIYWCILGYNESNQLCYMDKDGTMIPASLELNTETVQGRKVAPIWHTLKESNHVYAPFISSGRMYLSYEEPVYITFNQSPDGVLGYAGPDLNNPNDLNFNTLFEFAEFTIDGKYYWGNTTRVDYFSFPMITRLMGHTQYATYDKTVGDIGTRDEIYASFRNGAPEAFKELVGEKRIVAPCKGSFNEGQQYENYFDAYINEFWDKYAKEDLVFSCEGGYFTGRVEGNRMKFTRTDDTKTYYVDKPTTQEVLEGKGAFNNGNEVEKVIEAQLCAAFNRGVATEPLKWNKPDKYYQNTTNNYYAGFFHRNSVVGLAYGFCYDDVNDQSTLLQYDHADALIIDLKW